MKHYVFWPAVIGGVVTSIAALAHHSAVMFDTSREIVVDGIVTKYH